MQEKCTPPEYALCKQSILPKKVYNPLQEKITHLQEIYTPLQEPLQEKCTPLARKVYYPPPPPPPPPCKNWYALIMTLI